jgi:starvation-inducible DNA-binding protein
MAATTQRTRRKAGEPAFTIPGLETGEGAAAAGLLQERLNALLDLSLTLKHIHSNVVGPPFIGVHTMLDPQVEAVQAMVDETAERIATLGASPNGLAGALVSARSWDDYSLMRASTLEHLGALDLVYAGLIESHRAAIEDLEEIDLVSQDIVIGQAAQLEQFHWFVRAHLESPDGRLATAGATTEREAAARSRD